MRGKPRRKKTPLYVFPDSKSSYVERLLDIHHVPGKAWELDGSKSKQHRGGERGFLSVKYYGIHQRPTNS